jgi:hypothetical protein
VRLVDRAWGTELRACARAADGPVTIVSPFVKRTATQTLLHEIPDAHPVRLVTRFKLRDIAAGVSDLEAMRLVLDRGGSVRGLQRLHSKVYVFGTASAVVTSANLTDGGLNGSHEFGGVSAEATFVAGCASYAEQLWSIAFDVTYDELEAWKQLVVAARLTGATASAIDGLPDLGAPMPPGPEPAPPLPSGDPAPSDWPTDGQAFIKFFGESDSLAPLDTRVIDELVASRSFEWCTYPPSKRPRQPKDGDTMFLARA